MVKYSLKSKSALVTGCGPGSMGHAIALCLAEEGANVVICDLPHVSLVSVTAEIEALGVKCIALAADATKRDEIKRLFDEGEKAFGYIDIVVAALGGDPAAHDDKQVSETPAKRPRYTRMNGLSGISTKLSVETSWEEYMRITTLTQFATWHATQEAAQRMLSQNKTGRIIIIGSVMADMARPGAAPYISAKASIRQLARTLANELGPYQITVNTIQPGAILTQNEAKKLTPEQIHRISYNIPMRRMGDPRDIGNAVAFLASDAASYITGSVVDVDGGWTVSKTLTENEPPPEFVQSGN